MEVVTCAKVVNWRGTPTEPSEAFHVEHEAGAKKETKKGCILPWGVVG